MNTATLSQSSGLILACQACFAHPALAGITNTASGASSSQGYFFQLVAGLAIVLLSILALAWILKKVNRLPNKGQSAMAVEATLSIGQRERLVIVRSGDLKLLLGVSPGRISKLHVFSEDITDADSSQLSHQGSHQDSHPEFSTFMSDASKEDKP